MLPSIAWFVAAALAWATVDVAQAAWTSGGVGIVRLALLTLSLYAAMGLATAVVGVPLLKRRERGEDDPLGAALAPWLLFGFVFLAGYANVAFLPSITHPLSLLADLVLVSVVLLVWAIARRRPLFATLEANAGIALLLAPVFVAVSLALAWPASAPASRPGVASTADPALPSVFVVVLDSARVDRTSLGGRQDALMPAYESLVRRGWGFSRAWAQSSWTKPSVGSLFTSLYPSSHGATLRTGRLASGARTLPEIFAGAGYATAVFSSNPWISPAFGFDRGVGTFVESERESFVRLIVLHRLLRLVDKAVPGSPVRGALSSLERAFGVSEEHRSNCERDVLLVDRFEEWMDGVGEGPRFAYFHLMSPHIPYDPPGVAHEDFPDQEQVELQRVTTALPEERRRRLIELYEGALAHGDEMLGRILAILEAKGLADRAVIVATADHGEEFHEHGAWGHGNNLHEETIGVPLVLAAPGLSPRRIEEPVMLVDALPTLTALVGEAPAAPAAVAEGVPVRDGSDLRSLDEARPVHAELTREGGLESHAVARGSWKYLETRATLGAPVAKSLYDLDRDPGETNDRSVSTSAGVMQEWTALLATLREKAASRSFEEDNATIDADAAERLRALGYVE